MKRIFAPLGLLVGLLVQGLATAQGVGPSSGEEARIISLLGLSAGKSVADVGAGDGLLAVNIAKAVGPAGRVYATEIESSKRETITRNARTGGVGNVEVVEAQVESTGLPAACCDAIYMRDVYHHLTAPDQILADLRKSLREGGRVLIIDFEPRTSIPSVPGVRENRGGHGIPLTVLVKELETAGFEVTLKDPQWRSDMYAVLARLPRAPSAASATAAADELLDRIPGIFRSSTAQYQGLLDAIKGDPKLPRTFVDGKVRTVEGEDWTSGFFAGSLWYLFEFTGDARWSAAAKGYTERMEPIKDYRGSHDVGFMLNTSYGNGYRITHEPR